MFQNVKYLMMEVVKNSVYDKALVRIREGCNKILSTKSAVITEEAIEVIEVITQICQQKLQVENS